MSNKTTVRNLLAAILTAIFSVTLADAVFHISKMIVPGVSNIYNALGTQIAPNMVTVVIFDFRAYLFSKIIFFFFNNSYHRLSLTVQRQIITD